MRSRHRIREFVEEAKQGKSCLQCGFDDPRALEFHHRKGEVKRFRIGSASQYGKKTVKDEIAKCDLICANCHRLAHATEYFGLR